MAAQNFSIQIPAPCSENWEHMTPREKGKFCSACSKTVYDFTQMSNNDIAKVLTDNPEQCGVFTKEQLDTVYQIPQKERFNLAKFLAAAFLVFGMSLFSYSCELESPPLHLISVLSQNTPPDSANSSPSDSTSLIEADTLNLDEIVISSRKLTDRRALDYERHTIGVPIKILHVESVVINPPTQNIVSSIKVFPNPSTDFYQLQYSSALSGSSFSEIEIKIYDASGRLLEEENHPYAGGRFETVVSLTGQPAGIYFLQLIYGDEILKSKLIKRD